MLANPVRLAAQLEAADARDEQRRISKTYISAFLAATLQDRKRRLVFCTLLLAPFSLFAQSPSLDLKFVGHTLGEPADVFFLTARVVESKGGIYVYDTVQLTRDYCKSLLDNPKSKLIRDDPKTKGSPQLSDGVTLFSRNQGDRYPYWEVGDFRQVMAALKGDQARVRGNVASVIVLEGADLPASEVSLSVGDSVPLTFPSCLCLS